MSAVDDEKQENVGVAFALVIGAGLSTALGAAVVFFPALVKLASRRVLASALGISAGVMTYVSFVEIFAKSQDSFAEAGFDDNESYAYATLCFFGGVIVMLVSEAELKIAWSRIIELIRSETVVVRAQNQTDNGLWSEDAERGTSSTQPQPRWSTTTGSNRRESRPAAATNKFGSTRNHQPTMLLFRPCRRPGHHTKTGSRAREGAAKRGRQQRCWHKHCCSR